jgi:LysM repeat protein
MTICRSKTVALLVVASLGMWATQLHAQDTTTAAQPQTPAAGQTPETHTVSQGETLWSISMQYFGDPLLWPEIYRQNTAVIEDPHWIYPGEVLNLGGILAQGDTASTVPQGAADTTHADTTRVAAADTVAAPPDTGATDTTQVAVVDTTPAEPPPPPAEPVSGYQTIFDNQRTKQQVVQDVLRAYAHQVYRPLRRGEFYSAGFLSEREKLPWARVLGNTSRPSIEAVQTPTTAMPFEEIAVVPPEQASYHIGDSLLIARIDRQLDRWGDVVVPMGVARVTSVQRKQVLAQVLLEFGRIRDGRVAIPLEPFKDPGEVRPTAVEQGLEGHIVSPRDQNVLAGQQQVFFIDKGRADGVTLGDIFEAYKPAANELGTRSEEIRVQMMIVHTREHSASGLVIGISNPAVYPGMAVRLIKKMPS